jgi:hypothetical protein
MAKQPPLCRTGNCDFGTRHWPNERCLFTPVTPVTTKPPIVADGATPVMGRADVITSVIEPGEKCPTCDEVKRPTVQNHICDDECQEEEHRNIRRILNVKPEPGEDCALCERKMPSKNAQRQAAWRERHGA